ncbi:PREDICTED: uromodulin-like [Nanorana parkeri]|uniref:uromodulin-like n=1 Tax=Nanorana parkeri TaxID=125878 RepID=UPI00085479F2|nr:PREDICTED: uromodulin-like [Nanorana parkeri]
MGDDMYYLKLANGWLLDRIIARFPCGIRQYTMVEFNDPTVGPVRITYSKDEFAYFFNNLEAYDGGDCPELAIAGLKLALENSPDKSFILVLTDASALDYNNASLVNEVYRLLDTTQSQVFFVVTGLCGSLNDPDFLIYRDIASRSFGHVFQVNAADLNIVFNYLDFTLSKPVNNSKALFSGDYEDGKNSDSFTVSDNFTSLLVTSDGVISSLEISGPDSKTNIKTLVNETWGSIYIIKDPVRGNWTIEVEGSGKYSVRVEGLIFMSQSATLNCSKCHPEATCEDYFGYLQCSCKDGFIGDGFYCSDVDECAYYWSNKCGYYTCVNTYGSFYCTCPSGYHNDSGAGCVDIDECSNPGLNNCTGNATCTNTIGSYTCVCAPGYFGDGFSCEVDECALGVCGSDMECSKYYGSYSCHDPCLTYTTLSEPWRSTSYTYSSSSYYYDYYWHCDSDKFGWYRFVGSGGVKMPESCVSEYSCGTLAPMWLQGSHPLISDGIVNRTACASWSGYCCLWSTTVQIKSCPDNYYVYKLSGTPACSLAYCTDPSSVTDVCACAETEQCSLVDGKYGCYCKDEYKISDISEIRPIITCGAHDMKVSFLKCQLKSQDIDVNKLTIANIGCYTLQDDIVNGTYSKSTYYATFLNTIDITLGSSDDSSIPQELAVQMKCSYPLDLQLSLNTAINPMVSVINIVTEGTGQFKISMALFQDAYYTLPYTAPVVEMPSKSLLYVGVYLDGPGNSPYIVLMKNCFGTPTNNINDTIKYSIIKDSCPNKQVSTVSVPANGVSNEGRFSLQLFKFITGYSQIYLHCEINLCDPTTNICTPSCSDARSAGVKSAGQDYSISVGPVRVVSEISGSQRGAFCSLLDRRIFQASHFMVNGSWILIELLTALDDGTGHRPYYKSTILGSQLFVGSRQHASHLLDMPATIAFLVFGPYHSSDVHGYGSSR